MNRNFCKTEQKVRYDLYRLHSFGAENVLWKREYIWLDSLTPIEFSFSERTQPIEARFVKKVDTRTVYWATSNEFFPSPTLDQKKSKEILHLNYFSFSWCSPSHRQILILKLNGNANIRTARASLCRLKLKSYSFFNFRQNDPVRLKPPTGDARVGDFINGWTIKLFLEKYNKTNKFDSWLLDFPLSAPMTIIIFSIIFCKYELIYLLKDTVRTMNVIQSFLLTVKETKPFRFFLASVLKSWWISWLTKAVDPI